MNVLDAPATVSIDRCPLCASITRTRAFEGGDRLHHVPGRFPVVRCADCGCSYLAERPVDLSAYYPVERYAPYEGKAASGVPGRRYGLLRRRQLLEHLRPAGGALLDVGCGAGDFLALLRDRPGWEVSGLEQNAAVRRYARDRRGLDVREGELPCPALPACSYDVITMWHVLEHVVNPAEVLAEVRRLLKPDGVLVVGVPVADSLEAKWFGTCWAGYDVPRHLVTFTRASLRRFARAAGFDVEEHAGVVQSLASVRVSLGFLLGGRDGRWRRLRAIAAWVTLPPALALLRLLSGRELSVGVFAARVVSSHDVASADARMARPTPVQEDTVI